MKKATIVLPTYNEAGTIEKVIQQIFDEIKKKPNWQVEIVVVDSTSTDSTGDIVKKLQKKHLSLHLITTPKEGLGQAYIHGFTYAMEKLNSFVVFEMDSDLSHDPKKISEFLTEIEKGADFVIGSRYIKGGSIPENWAIYRKLLSGLGNIIIRLGFMSSKSADWTSGYRAIKTWVIKEAISYIQPYTGYVFQVALLDFAMKHKARIAQVPINFKDRTSGVSKIDYSQTIVQTLWYVFSHSSFIKFFIVGAIGFVIDFAISYLFIERVHTQVWIATLLSTETAIISNFFMNNFWSFAHKKVDHSMGSYTKGFFKFNLVSSGSIAIQTIGVQLLSSIFTRKLWYMYKVIIIVFVVIPYSYILYNKLIWKEK